MAVIIYFPVLLILLSYTKTMEIDRALYSHKDDKNWMEKKNEMKIKINRKQIIDRERAR